MKKQFLIFSILIFAFLFVGLAQFAQASTLSDNFDDGNFDGWVSTLPYTGAPLLGNWRVEDGQVIQDLVVDGCKLLLSNYSLSDQSVEARIFWNEGPVGLTIWQQNEYNWVVVQYPYGTGFTVSEKWCDSSSCGRDTNNTIAYYPHQFTKRDWQTLRVDANSLTGKLMVYLDDEYLFTHTVGANTRRTGLSGFVSSNAGGSFDDFRITSNELSSACTSWTYSDWSSCSSSGQQTRTVISSSPSGCTGGSPIITQSCTYIPPTCASWIYSHWSNCSASGQQTRTIASSSPSNCIGGNPILSQSCTPSTTTCTSWTYSNWGTCSSNGQQTRTVASSSPNSCIGGNPVLTQSCTYVPPGCTSFNYSSWSQCTPDGKQTRDITSKYPSNCEGGELSKTTQSCTYVPPCNADTWTCGSWNTCSASGIQSRSCTKTFDCSSAQTASPITDQYCEAPGRPQQAPPSESDEILNQNTIIKSTVKLLCPVDDYRATQGSGTVIDSSGTILTNKHVIAGTLGCWVGFIDGFNDEPYFGDRHIADITKISSTQDIAILKMRNPNNAKLSYVDVAKGSVNFPLGTKITTYGYPAKFGTKITYTSGDFSGTDGSYLKTTAILEYGNSGGGAYLKNGTFVGIPSAVVKGELNAMGYLLSIDVIKAWFNNSNITPGNTNNNKYSRVSVLEDMDLNKLDSLKLFIPDVDEKGNLSVSEKNKSSQKTTEQSQPNQTQKESTIIESPNSDQETSLEQSSSTPSEQNNENKEEKGKDSNIKFSEQRRSIVANAVQEIIKVADRNGEIGQGIKTIAQTQTQNQEKLETSIQKIQSRSGLAKFFIGPNYGEIKNSQKLLDQNKEQIEKLNELRTQIVNQGDQLQIIEQIQALEQVSQQMETSLNESQKGFSLFGWAFRLFSR